MNCVILFRINGGPVQGISETAGELREFPNIDEAIRHVRLIVRDEVDYQIVELDEL